jgi:hypothetical protein
VTVLGNQETVRMDMSPWQCRILKPQSSAIRDDLNGSKPRIHSFEAMWSIFCSSFKRCAMMPDSSCRQTLAECAQTIRVRVGGCGVKNSDHASEFFILSQSGVRYFFGCFAVSYGLGECGQVKLAVIE